MSEAIPAVQLPTYETKLPSTGKTVQFRPFVVKEEKILLLAIQEGNSERIVQALKQIILQCTDGKVAFDQLAVVDVEWLFLQIRNKSMGEGVEVKSTCVHCNHENQMTLDLSGVVLSNADGKPVENTIRLGENEWIVMSQPSLERAYRFVKDTTDEAVYETVATCIQKLIKGEQSYSFADYTMEQRVEWVQGLVQKQLEAINAYFASLPKITFDQDFVCTKCKGNNHIHLEGLQNFFD